MTHAAETGAENRLTDSIFVAPPISGPYVSYQCGTGFVWHQKPPASNRTLDYFQARNWRARVTEMMIYHHLLFIFVISRKQSVNSLVVIYLFIIIHRLRNLSAAFIFSARNFHSRRLWYEKPAPKTGAGITESIYGVGF